MRSSNLHHSAAASRREFLRTGLAGLGAATFAGAAGKAKGGQMPGYIDAHVHVWTPDTVRYPLADGFTKKSMQPPSFTPEQLFAHCKPCGVDRITLIQMSYYRYDNSYMLDMMKKHKGVFSGVAVIDAHAKPRATMRSLAKQGVRGFRIQPGKWLEDEGMNTMWSTGADDGLAMCGLINPDFLPTVDKMCAKFPRTPVVIDHFSRIGADGTIRKGDLDNLCALARHKSSHVKTSAFYALGKKKAPYLDLGPMIRRLLDAFGPERLMWASDCPFQVVKGHEYAPSIDLVRDRLDFLSDGDRDWLLRKTAEKVYFG